MSIRLIKLLNNCLCNRSSTNSKDVSTIWSSEVALAVDARTKVELI